MVQTFAVAGPPGSGKTTWIAKQAEALAQRSPLYCLLGGAGIALDGMLLASQCPELEVVADPTPKVLQQAIDQQRPLLIEIGSSVDLAQLTLPAEFKLEKVALLPPGWKSPELESWSDRLLPAEVSFATQPLTAEAQVCAIELTGQVFDPASLDLLWKEVTGGAYGLVYRAKGVFCLADGSVFYFSAVNGHESTYTQLNLAPCLEGRPSCYSALEVTGQELDGKVILATTQDCLLDDGLLKQHQAQLKAMQQEYAS